MAQAPVTNNTYQTATLLRENGFVNKNSWVGPTDTEEDHFSHRLINADGLEVEILLLQNGYKKGVETMPNMAIGRDGNGDYIMGEGHFVTFTKGSELVKWRNTDESSFDLFIFRTIR